MTLFANLGLSEAIASMLEKMGIVTPTPIQKAAIPIALQGVDLIASAQTGSGKTMAYSLPLIALLSIQRNRRALILTPTRELAIQVEQVLIRLLGPRASTALLIGGAPMGKQIASLRREPPYLIGTPGRIFDHLERGTLSLREVGFLVVDEADRMLDMGFGVQLDQIVKRLPEERQTLMFSATLPPHIEKLSKKHMRDPHRIAIDSSSPPKIVQEVLQTTDTEKFPRLLEELEKRAGSIILFVRTRRGAERLARELKEKGQHAEALHGDLSQQRRDRVVRSFRDGASRILVATDIAARGLDVPHVKHVINYDLPACAEDYVHRIGRTGRGEAEGHALCFVLPGDRRQWKAICNFIDPHAAATQAPRQRPAGGPRPATPRKARRSFRRGPTSTRSF